MSQYYARMATADLQEASGTVSFISAIFSAEENTPPEQKGEDP